MTYARTVLRLMHILNVNEYEYEDMSSHYNNDSPHADHMSFEEYLEREIEAGRLMGRRGDVAGRGGNPDPCESERRQEVNGRPNNDRSLLSRPGPALLPRESEHRSQEASGHSNHDRAVISRQPHESGHRSQEASGRSNNDRNHISHPRPRVDYMHHTTSPSRGSGDQRGTGCRDCDDSHNDDSFDDDSFSDDTPASSPSPSTSRFSETRNLREHRSACPCETSSLPHSRGTSSRLLPSSTDIHEFEAGHDYDDHPRGDRAEAIRPTTRQGPISHLERRLQSPPPTARRGYNSPLDDRITPSSPLTLVSPAQSLTSIRSSQAYSADGRSGAGYDAPPRGTQRGPLGDNGVRFGEAYYDAQGGRPTGNRPGGGLRD